MAVESGNFVKIVKQSDYKKMVIHKLVFVFLSARLIKRVLLVANTDGDVSLVVFGFHIDWASL